MEIQLSTTRNNFQVDRFKPHLFVVIGVYGLLKAIQTGLGIAGSEPIRSPVFTQRYKALPAPITTQKYVIRYKKYIVRRSPRPRRRLTPTSSYVACHTQPRCARLAIVLTHPFS